MNPDGNGKIANACEHINNSLQYCCNNGLGNYIKIKHDDGTYAMYSHLKFGSITVGEGQKVEEGQVIGIMGASGRTDKVCLHFTVAYSDDSTINTNPDSMSYYYPTEEENQEETREEWKVNSETGVNFRSGAGTEFQAINKIPYDTIVQIDEIIEIEDLQWGKTTYDGEVL